MVLGMVLEWGCWGVGEWLGVERKWDLCGGYVSEWWGCGWGTVLQVWLGCMLYGGGGVVNMMEWLHGVHACAKCACKCVNIDTISSLISGK